MKSQGAQEKSQSKSTALNVGQFLTTADYLNRYYDFVLIWTADVRRDLKQFKIFLLTILAHHFQYRRKCNHSPRSYLNRLFYNCLFSPHATQASFLQVLCSSEYFQMCSIVS